MNLNRNDVWVILSNNVPVEVHQDELTAKQIASEWNQQSQTYITCYRVPLRSPSPTFQDGSLSMSSPILCKQ